MKHVKRFLALSLAAALLAGCVSCGNSDEKTSPTGGGSGVDSTGDGGTLRIAMTCAALPNTDSEPTEGQEGYRFVSFQLYDALVKWDASSETEAGKIIPGLATSWEQNPENPKRWTFHLREGVKFHDGTDFKADCVIFALDRVMNPDFEYYSTTCAASVGSFLANIESYAKVDDYTITIDTVQDNNAYLIYDLPYIMIPSMEAVKEKGDGFADAPVGSGPFRFVSKIAGQELVMERNENYWGNVPQIKTLILKPISDASARLAALQSGEVDWAEVVPVESLESLKSQGYQVKLNDYPHAWLYIMNTESGPFADARVRQAFSMSIDREGLCNDILQGVGTPLAQLMYPGSPWYAEGVEEYTYNPERAKELLAEAGYPDGFYLRIDARSDIYSAGVVLYEMITGRLPYEGESPVAVAIQHINSIPLSPREIDPEIPEALEAITMKAMASDVNQRYVSADAMLVDLEEFRKNPSINFDYTPADLLIADGDEPTQILGANTPHTVRSQPAHASRAASEEPYARPTPKPRKSRAVPLEDEVDYDDYPAVVCPLFWLLQQWPCL